jgi:hypothetical protein
MDFTNRDESGLPTDVNGFGEIDYKVPGDEYGHLASYEESPLSTSEEEDLEELSKE